LSRNIRILLSALLLLTLVFVACKGGEEELAEPEAFSFVVYPGSRYLGQLTENTKAAHKVINPAAEPPPTAIYDTEAPMEQVAEYYAKQYGYQIVPEANLNLNAAKPPARWRTGDLAADTKAIEPIIKQMNLPTDVSKAAGAYKAADIEPRPNRPRVTVQRPYFDVLTSQVVDRTLILMSR
jgi:hypothetical protein